MGLKASIRGRQAMTASRPIFARAAMLLRWKHPRRPTPRMPHRSRLNQPPSRPAFRILLRPAQIARPVTRWAVFSLTPKITRRSRAQCARTAISLWLPRPLDGRAHGDRRSDRHPRADCDRRSDGGRRAPTDPASHPGGHPLPRPVMGQTVSSRIRRIMLRSRRRVAPAVMLRRRMEERVLVRRRLPRPPSPAPRRRPRRGPRPPAPRRRPRRGPRPRGGRRRFRRYAPPIPHALTGRDNCLLCHAPDGGVNPAPADHAGRTVESCQACHKPTG